MGSESMMLQQLEDKVTTLLRYMRQGVVHTRPDYNSLDSIVSVDMFGASPACSDTTVSISVPRLELEVALEAVLRVGAEMGIIAGVFSSSSSSLSHIMRLTLFGPVAEASPVAGLDRVLLALALALVSTLPLGERSTFTAGAGDLLPGEAAEAEVKADTTIVI
jgi:hypothetical protein